MPDKRPHPDRSVGGERSVRVGFRVGGWGRPSETFIRAQIIGIQSRGFQVSILADAIDTDLPVPPGVQLVTTEPRQHLAAAVTKRTPWRIRRVWTASQERAWGAANDVVVSNFGWFGAQFASAFRQRESCPPFITIFHGDDVSRSLRQGDERIYDEVFARCPLMLTVSEHWRERLVALGAPPERVRVFHMGVDPAAYAFKQRSPIGPVRSLLHVGRLVEKKGTATLLRALALARNEAGGEALHLNIVGGGPLEEELKYLAASLGVASFVTFHGTVAHSQVRAMLANADAFILPSVTATDGDMEGIPVSLMEAMASGVPVISTRHSGIPELIEHETSGFLAKERDERELAKLISRLVQNPDARNTLTLAARRVVKDRFNQDKLHDELADYILTLATC